jgi:class 3 adenylate cyclase
MIDQVPELNVEGFEALGVYDPSAPHAAQRLELLQYLVGLGATADDLVARRDDLPGLAAVVSIRAGRALTMSEAVERSGISEEKLLRILRAAGFAQPGPGDRVIAERVADLAAGLAAAESVFGDDAVVQLLRVMGSAMARLADAIVSAFLVNVEPAVPEDPVGLGVARANAEAAELMPTVNAALDILLRQHIIAAQRSSVGVMAETGYESRRMCVGFLDLVGSTALTQRLSTRELGSVITEFEHVAADAVTSAGGRVVKLIGDEVLYTAPDEAVACTIALNLSRAFAVHPVLPTARAGVAAGDVVLRDGDVFGPVVNLAARAAKVAAAGEVVAPAAVAAAAGIRAEPLGPHQLQGFEAVELCRLSI